MLQHVISIRNEFKHLNYNKKYVTDKSGVKMLEIQGACFTADEDAIFGTVNADYVQRELDWYTSMSLCVNDIPGGKQEANPPVIWTTVSDSNGMINSNYGWCIWSEDNNSQYDHALQELKSNPESRRAVMIYTRPTMWDDYNRDGMSDFMCTNAVQYMIRDNKLNCVVQMRSNDAIFGYKNDKAWQQHVLDKMANQLDIEPGEIIWQVGSLHIYERHFGLIA
jgi:thymidylate synthase